MKFSEWWRSQRNMQQPSIIGGQAPKGMTGIVANAGQNQQSPAAAQGGPNPGVAKERQSNIRYRSFAERFVIERVRNLQNVDDHVLHGLTLQARTAYKMIKETGYTLDPSD
jgi:hypothetical protein